MRENQTAQCLQRFFLLGRQFARRAIHDAKCSECVTIFVNKGRAGVEADMRVRNDKRIVAKAIVCERIGNYEDIILQNGRGAKGNVSRGIRSIQTHARLEPLAIFVDK